MAAAPLVPATEVTVVEPVQNPIPPVPEAPPVLAALLTQVLLGVAAPLAVVVEVLPVAVAREVPPNKSVTLIASAMKQQGLRSNFEAFFMALLLAKSPIH